jgi:hypothetical protein
MKIRFLKQLDEIDPQAWNRLVSGNDPFLKHEFLAALERHHCVGAESGWLPQHIAVYSDSGTLIGATPLYLKQNSYGEFVFDWSWAEAYQRHGLAYYPKLVCAIPFTPLTGQRLLVAATADHDAVRTALTTATIELAQQHHASSAHWLFTTPAERDLLQQQGMALRLGCQYHWHNRGYESFDHYLEQFSSRKRKNILKERRQVQEMGVTFRILHGHEVTAAEWRLFHHYYCALYDRKWGVPSLTLGFFEEIGRTLAEQVVLVLAYRHGGCIAAALNLRSDETLYGRHWGCRDQLPALHFEACYYQGLEYCIANGLQRFEPGAQGEHKIARGFLPTATWSAHWIAHPEFRQAIAQFCRTEWTEMERQMAALQQLSPFRHDVA